MKCGIVMPTFNQSKWLDAALDSVKAQDIQPAPEFVAVDDGSTDHTAKILDRRNVRRIHHTHNQGTAAAINTGVSLLSAECDALTWISSDNVMMPDWLSTLAEEMKIHGAGAVYAAFWYEKPGAPPWKFFREHTPNGLLTDLNCYYGPAFLIRRDVWLEAGPHRGKICHDYSHWLRVEEVCFAHALPIIGVDRPLCHYNAHDERATVVRRNEFDAREMQREAQMRRSK